MTEKIDMDALIDAAFKAHEGAPTWEDDPVGRDAAIRWHMRGFMDALAVFEKAHAPTDDEREALVRILATKRMHSNESLGRHGADADAILAAGFRRGAPADREQIAGEIAAEREDTEDGFGFEAYINGLIRAGQIVREGR